MAIFWIDLEKLRVRKFSKLIKLLRRLTELFLVKYEIMHIEPFFEFYLVDSSKHMNELCEILLRDGNENKSMTLNNVYFRQFLPSRENSYDLVVSAYTMFEMPSLRNRNRGSK